MIIVTNTSKITKNYGQKLVDRFNKVGKVETMDGFLGLEVLLTDNLKEFDEVTVSTRWESKDAFNIWLKSDAFKEAHSYKGGKPEYILDNKISFYDVKIVREPIALA